MAPGLKLLLQNGPVYVEVIESLDKVALCAVGDGHHDVGVVHSEGLVLG